MIDYKKYINEVSDFPIEGISFKDISPLLADRTVFKKVIDDQLGWMYQITGLE